VIIKWIMSRHGVDIKQPILSQPQFCQAAGMNMVMANNLVARRILLPSEIGGRHIKGTRLYSISKAYEGRIISETATHHKVPLADAAAIGRLATEGGYIEHWARALDANKPLIAAFMVVAWSKGCYDAQVINGDKSGLPNFASLPTVRRRFFKHPVLVLPLSELFVDVWRKCMAMLSSEQKQ
jgi:hypothetical protein